MIVSVPVTVLGLPAPLVGRTGAIRGTSGVGDACVDGEEGASTVVVVDVEGGGSVVVVVDVEGGGGGEDVVSSIVVLAVVVKVLTTVEVGMTSSEEEVDDGKLMLVDNDLDVGTA